jgi:transcriptional regulator with PAS, ATPase and Fis domain
MFCGINGVNLMTPQPSSHLRQNPIEPIGARGLLGGLVGESRSIQQVYRQIEIVSHHNFPVLIIGESGTGKELAARLIHDLAPCRPRPFAPIDCSALAPTLIESELFGYVKGAFTGAEHSRMGLLQAANGGTLFLDEIGELPLHCQAKLMRALQEREVRPVGGIERFHIDARVIAATNRNLELEVKAGHFRQDLYFRLNVLQINLPALRDHKSDIPLLIDSFLEKFSGLRSSVRSVSEEAMRCLLSYSWPGNVRELENAIEHALALCEGSIAQVCDLPSSLQNASNWQTFPETTELLTLYEIERRAIFNALSKTNGDKMAAAHLLHIGKTTLYRKLKEYAAISRCL